MDYWINQNALIDVKVFLILTAFPLFCHRLFLYENNFRLTEAIDMNYSYWLKYNEYILFRDKCGALMMYISVLLKTILNEKLYYLSEHHINFFGGLL